MFYFNTDNQNTSFIRNLQVISGEGGTLSTLENSWELGMNEDLPLSVSLIQKYRLWKIAVNLLFLIITFTVFDVTFR